MSGFNIVDRTERSDALVLAKMQAAVTQVNQANGWFDHDRSFGDDMALLHSEVSEAFEAYRSWKTEDKTRRQVRGCRGPLPEDQNIHGTCVHGQEWNICVAESPLEKPEGVGSELADVLVRLLDTCERYGIDLEAEFIRKLEYNKTRGYHHGGKHL